MNPIWLEILGVVLRAALSALSGYLVEHHIATADQTDRWTTAIVEHAVLWAPGAAALAWGLWARYRGKQKLLVALSSDVKMSENEVTAIVKSGVPTPTVSTPKNTIPGVPA
jgi:hypothetical protein